MAATTFTIAENTAFGLQQAANGLGISVEELAERAIRSYLRESAKKKLMSKRLTIKPNTNNCYTPMQVK